MEALSLTAMRIHLSERLVISMSASLSRTEWPPTIDALRSLGLDG